MKLRATLICLASCAMLTACASSPSMRPMATLRTDPPLECRVRCDNPPPLGLAREVWEAAVVLWGADCKALHDDCVSALAK